MHPELRTSVGKNEEKELATADDGGSNTDGRPKGWRISVPIGEADRQNGRQWRPGEIAIGFTSEGGETDQRFSN